jgi:hypothetical protein
MLSSQNQYCEGRNDAEYHNYAKMRGSTRATGAAAQLPQRVMIGLAALAAWVSPLQAGIIPVPNASFESPIVPIEVTPALPDMDYWQKSAQPTWYDPANFGGYPWDTTTGTFYNFHTSPPDTFIDNCDGSQAAFLFAFPDVAVFQDYNSIYGTNTTPSHAFDAKFNVGSAYTLTVGVIGGGGGMTNGVPLQLSLYYRDASSNMVTVAATTITNASALFPTNTHFVDFSVHVPGVLPTNAWANQNIGVQIASTVGFDLMGGYWDVDNVRLIETILPALSNPQVTNGQCMLTVQSLPGLPFEMLAQTNLSSPLSNWTSLGTFLNQTGTTNFLDPAANLDHRFYRARQLQ